MLLYITQMRLWLTAAKIAETSSWCFTHRLEDGMDVRSQSLVHWLQILLWSTDQFSCKNKAQTLGASHLHLFIWQILLSKVTHVWSEKMRIKGLGSRLATSAPPPRFELTTFGLVIQKPTHTNHWAKWCRLLSNLIYLKWVWMSKWIKTDVFTLV